MSEAGERKAERRGLLLAPATTYRIADFLDAARGLGIAVTVGSDHRQTLEALSGGGTMTVDLSNRERGVARIVEFDRDRPIAAMLADLAERGLLGHGRAPWKSGALSLTGWQLPHAVDKKHQRHGDAHPQN